MENIHPGWAVASVTASGVLTWLIIWVLRRILPMHPPPQNGAAARQAAEKLREQVRRAIAESDAIRELQETVEEIDRRSSNLVIQVREYHNSITALRVKLDCHIEENV